MSYVRLNNTRHIVGGLVSCTLKANGRTLLVGSVLPVGSIRRCRLSSRIEQLFLRDSRLSGGRDGFGEVGGLEGVLGRRGPSIFVSFLNPPGVQVLLTSLKLPVAGVISIEGSPCERCNANLGGTITGTIFHLTSKIMFRAARTSVCFRTNVHGGSQIVCGPIGPIFCRRR